MSECWIAHGRRYEPEEMSDSHLINAIKLLERNAKQKFFESFDRKEEIKMQVENGEYEEELGEFVIKGIDEATIEDYLPPIHSWLKGEAEERGLDWKLGADYGYERSY